MLSSAFWLAAFERAARTFAQTVLGVISADGLGLLDVGWVDALSAGGLAAVAALLTAVVLAPAGGPGPGITEEVHRRTDADLPRI